MPETEQSLPIKLTLLTKNNKNNKISKTMYWFDNFRDTGLKSSSENYNKSLSIS